MKVGDSYVTTIEDWSVEGRGIAHVDGRAVFLEGALPGDRCRAVIDRVKKRYAIGHVTEILEDSPDRRLPSSEDDPVNDAYDLIALRPEAQIRWKKRRIFDAMQRIGGLSMEFEFLAMPEQGYRNKVLFRVDVQGRLCRVRRRTQDLLPITDDPMLVPALQALVREWTESVADALTARGLSASLQAVLFRANSAGERMIVLLLDAVGATLRDCFFSCLQEHLRVEVLCACENRIPGEVRLRKPLYFGTARQQLCETLFGLEIFISPDSFFQINRDSVELLYERALSFFGDLRGQTVLDLYCGTGTTSLLLAQRGAHVIGVESSASAVNDAKINAAHNGITSVRFLCAKAEDVVGMLRETEHATRALVDPPRAGLHPKVVDAIADSMEQLVYISCNPATLARDSKRFYQRGWEVQKLLGLDQFLNTSHVETVVLLSKEK